MRKSLFTCSIPLALAVVCLPAFVPAQSGAVLAPKPPMGWNSWDSYGTTVRENQVKANADVMARKLASYGWKYVVVDIQWYEPNAQGHDYKPGAPLTMDANGRLTPSVNRFPSAAGGHGFAPLADYVHREGLKFGIHIMRGIPRQAVDANTPIFGTKIRAAAIADRKHLCDWNPDMYGIDMSKPGAQEYYDSIAALYASWGVDFIKADDMSRPYDVRRPEVVALSKAIRKTGRPMVLSLSPGPAPVSAASDLRQWAQMWRISDDFWDDWKLLRKQFDYTRDWAPFAGIDNTWPDADMLPLGKLRITDAKSGPQDSKFTADEKQTMVTLWAVVRSPLVLGGDLPTLDAKTLALITNSEVLAINQDSAHGQQLFEKGSIRAWSADAQNGAVRYIALFNLGSEPAEARYALTAFGIQQPTAEVRDLWSRRALGRSREIAVKLPAHGSALYSLRAR